MQIDSQPIAFRASGGFGGADVETHFLWTLTDGLASYVLDFNAAEIARRWPADRAARITLAER